MKTILAIALMGICFTANADQLHGRVVGVADGDTVTVLDASNKQHKIRLMGIDAPEKKQAFGQKSKEHLADLIFKKQVMVEYFKQDRYGRTIGKILVDGVDANLEQVKAGLAWHYRAYEKDQSQDDRRIYSKVESGAKNARIGLWAQTNPIPPWDWRKQRRNKE